MVKDVLMVLISHEYFGVDKNERETTIKQFLVLIISLMLEDIGQTYIQFAYYEQFINSLDVFAIMNATVMVRWIAAISKR